MKERPILFSAPMVRAILDGRKTQTRRIVNKKHLQFLSNITENFLDGKWDQRPFPYGKPGDRLWVRETHWMDKRDILCAVMDLDGFAVDAHPAGRNKFVKDFHSLKNNKFWKKRPSIHMPRIASRILLEVKNVRVERLQDISEEDAIAEGVDGENEAAEIGCSWYEKPKRAYRRLWNSINGTGSWDLNPWVWVVEFKVLEIKK